MSQNTGKLYLIPTTLGENEPLEVLPLSVKKIVEGLTFFIVENEKSARRFIKKITPRNFDEFDFESKRKKRFKSSKDS